MRTIYFICDESGAKGYADKEEKFLGETGVMAGFVIPSENIDEVRLDLDVIRKKYISAGKLHITEIPPDNQEKLRNEIFKYFIKRQIPCLYEAIHSQGFHEYSKSVKEIKKQAKNLRKSKIKISSSHTKYLLHEQLFQGAFGKAVAFCLDYIDENIELNVITDTIDESIRKIFTKTAHKLLNFETTLKSRKVTGFDPEKEVKVEGVICTNIEDPAGLLGNFSGMSFSIKSEDSSLTLAADIIANSLHYHFRQREDENIVNSLNTNAAINGHPLEQLIYGTWNQSEQNYYADAVFMHPEKQKKT
jgi:hypothetical protein